MLITGDEPLLIAKNTQCPVVIDADRSRAVRFMLNEFDVDVILSDDGLQHYKMYRDVEICVVDENGCSSIKIVFLRVRCENR